MRQLRLQMARLQTATVPFSPHLPPTFSGSASSIFLKYKDGTVRDNVPRSFLLSSRVVSALTP